MSQVVKRKLRNNLCLAATSFHKVHFIEVFWSELLKNIQHISV